MRLFYSPNVDSEFELPPEEAAHCSKVLRLKENDQVDLTNGKGIFYKAVICGISNKSCRVRILNEQYQKPIWKGHIHIAVSPVKLMDRNEWFIEKAVEIGVDEISFIHTCHSERDSVKMDRIERVAISAMKQSIKARLPKINPMISYDSFIAGTFSSDKFIAHCYENDKSLLIDGLVAGNNALVMIGPEGDFSQTEVLKAVERGFVPVSLGPSRLRTETASLVACHIVNIVNRR